MAKQAQRRPFLMGAAVAVAIVGSLIHSAREFGISSVLMSRNAELPMLAVWLAAFAFWLRGGNAATPARWTLFSLAVLNLVGEAVLTALPLGFLPFEPGQSWDHYLSHVIYGLAQIPTVLLGMRPSFRITSSHQLR